MQSKNSSLLISIVASIPVVWFLSGCSFQTIKNTRDGRYTIETWTLSVSNLGAKDEKEKSSIK